MALPRPLTIAFEAHDGSGKTTTVRKLAEMLGAETWIADERADLQELKSKRKAIVAKYPDECIELDSELNETYFTESKLIKNYIEKMDNEILVIDRTFVSHMAERYARSELSARPDLTSTWLDGVFQPDLVFHIEIIEEERIKRITSDPNRPPLSDREMRIASDNEYRKLIEEARDKLGCIRLRVRKRKLDVVSFRVLQVILTRRDTSISLDQLSY
jgi:thymidylate kinase